ncbi:hypothetical protein D5086_013635 [Populus alba]|uniref:Uncharacterized protein n=4 Tax=Populus TaxID=3689 RepID=A0ACC4C665_POPAL|nr:hypothetical protein NC653_017418 [Populus alba x Populus x berolinensis]TKR99656.1 uncharacterized protein D5086_0000190860 [Populus alba]
MKAGQGKSSMIRRMVKRLSGPPVSYPDHLQEQNEQLYEDDVDESSDLQGTAEEWKGSNLPDSTESFQDLGSSGKIASTGPKSEPYNSQVGMDSFPKDSITCSQDSSILEPQYCESKELDEFIIQGPIHLETNTNPEQQDLNLPAIAKNSSNGSNSIKSQDAEFCKKIDSCEKDQASPSSKEFFLSECEEVPFINQDVWRPSVSFRFGCACCCWRSRLTIGM